MISALLTAIVLLPLLGSIFTAASQNDHRADSYNAWYVSVLTIVTDICLILLVFPIVKNAEADVLFLRLKWSSLPLVEIVLGADTLSLLMMLAVQLSVLIGILGLRQRPFGRKNVLSFSLIFLSLLNGYLTARDLLTFYVFFSVSVVPLLMACGFAGVNRKGDGILRFFVFNTFGAFLFLCAVVYAMFAQSPDAQTQDVLSGAVRSPIVFGGLFVAFVFRLPVWPFYKAVTPALKNINNPLVFIDLNILPVTGIYGLIRFWSDEPMRDLPELVPFFGALCLLSMLIAACQSAQKRSLHEKLFAYMIVYDLLYLSAVFLPTDVLKMNIGYSLFSFLILISLLAVLVFHIRTEKARNPHIKGGILCLLPKTSFVYAVSVLAAIGLPITALFWNNFMILSQIFDYDLRIGCVVMLSLTLTSAALLNNWYELKKRTCFETASDQTTDLDAVQFTAYLSVMIILFLSFIKPLWFVF